MGPKIDSPRPQVLRAPERKEVPTAALAPQQKTLAPTPKPPTDGFVPQLPTNGGKTPTGGIVPQRPVPASLSLDPARLEGFKKLQGNLIDFAYDSGLKGREARKTFEAAFILAGATKKEAKFLGRETYRALAAKAPPGSGGLAPEKYGYRLAATSTLHLDKEAAINLGPIKGMTLEQFQAHALETASKTPDVQPDQVELARDYYIFSVGKLLSSEGFDFGKIAKPASPLDTTRVDTGEWRSKLQFLP